jgi:hypothetical protein
MKRFDLVALIMAILVEAGLTVAAAFGGPHGVLGGWPWLMQLPGILLIWFSGGESVALLVSIGIAVQLTLWYLLFAFALRRYRTRASR